MIYIFEEEDLLAFVEDIQNDALDADGNFLDCFYDSNVRFLEEAKSWATTSKECLTINSKSDIIHTVKNERK